MYVHPDSHVEFARQRHAGLIEEARACRAGKATPSRERLARRWLGRLGLAGNKPNHEQGELEWTCT
jgi:hypothetical protein